VRKKVKWKRQTDFRWKANASLIQYLTHTEREQRGNVREKLDGRWCARGGEMETSSRFSKESNMWCGSCMLAPHYVMENGIVPSRAMSRSLFHYTIGNSQKYEDYFTLRWPRI
jgi:hypothetical protein